MISQLLAVIMMACGVASGTKATSNTFYDEKEKPNKKYANTNVVFQINKGYEKIGNTITLTDNNTITYLTKHKLEGTNSSNQLITDYLYIDNTTYESIQSSPNLYSTNNYQIYQIHNYFDAELTIRIELSIYASGGGNTTSNMTWIKEYDNLEDVIDLTVNASTMATLNSKFWGGGTVLDSTDQNVPITDNLVGQQITITMQPNSSKGILFRQFRVINTGAITDVVPQAFQIKGNAVIDYTQYEVIDLPGLMYTILTMPFSFISTAFNLTIFDGTPYQLNFANLFMVLLSAFILAWIIKKVFH